VRTAHRLIAQKGLEGFPNSAGDGGGDPVRDASVSPPLEADACSGGGRNQVGSFSRQSGKEGMVPANVLSDLRNESFDLVARVRQSPEQVPVTWN